ncbi:hypothetical protein LLS1_03890 [Leifsonia sp. LS1]|uniref:hypothetical protein n=1 Tax=Leifsonia sp. LS1 TaxID=2828483 RepID=UPI001CFE0DBB|nr:hypothetical protein [Leifsonia sp. LS1]GIT78720.1 hypothetical protein LLS1_03890 [Leifsonia sp. LS1]
MKLFLLIGGAAALVLSFLLGMGQLAVAQHNSCVTLREVPIGAFAPEKGGVLREAHLALWPIGEACSWVRADPDGQVREGIVRSHVGDYATSLVTYGLAACGVLGLVAGAARRRIPTTTGL